MLFLDGFQRSKATAASPRLVVVPTTQPPPPVARVRPAPAARTTVCQFVRERARYCRKSTFPIYPPSRPPSSISGLGGTSGLELTAARPPRHRAPQDRLSRCGAGDFWHVACVCKFQHTARRKHITLHIHYVITCDTEPPDVLYVYGVWVLFVFCLFFPFTDILRFDRGLVVATF